MEFCLRWAHLPLALGDGAGIVSAVTLKVLASALSAKSYVRVSASGFQPAHLLSSPARQRAQVFADDSKGRELRLYHFVGFSLGRVNISIKLSQAVRHGTPHFRTKAPDIDAAIGRGRDDPVALELQSSHSLRGA